MNTVIAFIIGFIIFIFSVLYFKFLYNTKKEFVYNLLVAVLMVFFAIYNFMHLDYVLGLVNVVIMLSSISDAFLAYDKYFNKYNLKV